MLLCFQMCCDSGNFFCVCVTEGGYMNVFVNASLYACLKDEMWNSIVLKPASSEAGSDISGNNSRPQGWMRFIGDLNPSLLSYSAV